MVGNGISANLHNSADSKCRKLITPYFFAKITDNYAVITEVRGINVVFTSDGESALRVILLRPTQREIAISLHHAPRAPPGSICETREIHKNNSYRAVKFNYSVSAHLFPDSRLEENCRIYCYNSTCRGYTKGKYWSCALSKPFVSFRRDFSFPLITLRHSSRVHRVSPEHPRTLLSILRLCFDQVGELMFCQRGKRLFSV